MTKNNLFLLLLLIIVYGGFVAPGPPLSSDLHFLYLTDLKNQFDFPFVWGAKGAVGLGEYAVSVLWSWPVNLFFGFWGILGFKYHFLIVLFGLVPFLFAGTFGMYYLLGYFKITGNPRLVGIFFFLANSYVLLLIDGGQLSLAIAYSLIPLAFYFFRTTIDQFKLKKIIHLIFTITFISIFDIRILYFVFLLFGLNFLFDLIPLFRSSLKVKIALISRYTISALVIMVFLIAVHSYWLLPSILAKPPQLPQTYTRDAQVDFLSFASLGHTLFLQQPHWPKNIFGQISQLSWEFVFIPTLVFLAPILKRKNKWVGFWLIISLVTIFLAKGSQEPLPEVYKWLFHYIPGFNLFRDPTKFLFLTALGYSVLIAFSVQEIEKRHSLLKNFSLIVILLLFFMARPIYFGQMLGTFSPPVQYDSYLKLANILGDDKEFSRVLWIPTKPPMGYTDSLHPSIEASRLIQKRSFATGTVGAYETLNYLREATYTGQLLNIASVGYIAYPPLDTREGRYSKDEIKYYDVFLNQLKNLPWVEEVITDSSIPLLKLAKPQELFFMTANAWLVVGSDDVYRQTTKKTNLSLANNSLIFADEYPGLLNKFTKYPEINILLNQKNATDFAAGFIDDKKLIFPANNLDFSPNITGWWKREGVDIIWWRDFLQTKYQIDNQDFDLGGGWAIAEGNLKLQVDNNLIAKDKLLLARVFESSRSGQISFYQGNQQIGRVDTSDVSNSFHWFEIGKLSGNQPIRLTSEGDINVVNALAIIEEKEWTEFIGKTKKLNDDKRVLEFQEENIAEYKPSISYKTINPTKYVVNISGLKEPSVLVLSQNFDSGWFIDNQESFPVYSFLNGFIIEKNGEYIVEYKAQKYVYTGLIISAVAVVILLLLIIFIKVVRRYN